MLAPQIRKAAQQYEHSPVGEVKLLLSSAYHEERLLALLIMSRQFQAGSAATRRRIFTLYLAHTHRINNWDLVDLSAPQLVGAYLEKHSRAVLYRLARSRCLWERRIAVLATFWFIRNHDFADSFKIAASLLEDEQDLIHKAVGWMLREIGKRDRQAEELFLKQHYQFMPRTMLRYAIERLPERLRQAYLLGRV